MTARIKPIEDVERAAWSRSEWCERWGICASTFHALVRGGKLKPVKIFGKVLVTATEDRRFAASLEFTATNGQRGRPRLGARSSHEASA
jgi:hypothetical protein